RGGPRPGQSGDREHPPLRLLSRYAGSPGQEEPRLHDRVPRRRPDADRRRGERPPRDGRRAAHPAVRTRAAHLRSGIHDHDEGRHRRAHLRQGRLLEEGSDRGGGGDLRAAEATAGAWREGEGLGLRQFRREREAAAQGPQPADRRGDRDLRPPRAHLQGEPGAEADDERRHRARQGRRRVSAGDVPPAGLPDRLYFKIGEVARLVGVKPYVLRYWETEFSVVRPGKTRSRHRLYRRKDVETLLEIRRLLYAERYTIEGAKRRLRENPRSLALEEPRPAPSTTLAHVRDELRALHRLLTTPEPAPALELVNRLRDPSRQ